MKSEAEVARDTAAQTFKAVYLDTGNLYVFWNDRAANDLWYYEHSKGEREWNLEEVVIQIMYDFPDWSERLVRGLLHQYYNGLLSGTTAIAKQREQQSEEAQG